MGAAVLLFVLLVFLLYYRMARRNTRLLAEEKDRAERAFAEAQQASLAKTEFLSRMSHEIRTPMNGIMGMTAIALESIGDDGKVRTCLEKVTLSSEHLLSLINDILDMSKIESGKVEIKNEPFDLSTFIGSLAAVFRTQASERNVAFDTVVEGEVPGHVVGDPLRLNQVVYNLVAATRSSPTPARAGASRCGIERLEADRRRGPGASGCGSRSTTRAAASSPSTWTRSSPRSSRATPPWRASTGARGWGWPSRSASWSLWAGASRVASVVGHGSSFAVDVPLGRATGEPARRRTSRRPRRPPRPSPSIRTRTTSRVRTSSWPRTTP